MLSKVFKGDKKGHEKHSSKPSSNNEQGPAYYPLLQSSLADQRKKSSTDNQKKRVTICDPQTDYLEKDVDLHHLISRSDSLHQQLDQLQAKYKKSDGSPENSLNGNTQSHCYRSVDYDLKFCEQRLPPPPPPGICTLHRWAGQMPDRSKLTLQIPNSNLESMPKKHQVRPQSLESSHKKTSFFKKLFGFRRSKSEDQLREKSETVSNKVVVRKKTNDMIEKRSGSDELLVECANERKCSKGSHCLYAGGYSAPVTPEWEWGDNFVGIPVEEQDGAARRARLSLQWQPLLYGGSSNIQSPVLENPPEEIIEVNDDENLKNIAASSSQGHQQSSIDNKDCNLRSNMRLSGDEERLLTMNPTQEIFLNGDTMEVCSYITTNCSAKTSLTLNTKKKVASNVIFADDQIGCQYQELNLSMRESNSELNSSTTGIDKTEETSSNEAKHQLALAPSIEEIDNFLSAIISNLENEIASSREEADEWARQEGYEMWQQKDRRDAR